jgi:hypothetical protein
MVLIVCAVVSTIAILYSTAVDEEKERLEVTARSQARLIEAMAKFDAEYYKGYSDGPSSATLQQIINSHNNYKVFGKTGEFVLAYKKDDRIVSVFSHRKEAFKTPDDIPLFSDDKIGEPIRLAVTGNSGSMIGYDYHGRKVLAAYEPVKDLGMGIVSKIDMSEIRAPFIKAGMMSGGIGLVFIGIGATLYLVIINPMIRKMNENIAELENAMAKVKLLRGLIPICASCKKIRNDAGYWEQIETYIKNHSEAEFSHGICPECAKILYPDKLDE